MHLKKSANYLILDPDAGLHFDKSDITSSYSCNTNTPSPQPSYLKSLSIITLAATVETMKRL